MASSIDGPTAASAPADTVGDLNGVDVVEIGLSRATAFAGHLLARHGAGVTHIVGGLLSPPYGPAVSDWLHRNKDELSWHDGMGLAALCHAAGVVVTDLRDDELELLDRGLAAGLDENPYTIVVRLSALGRRGQRSGLQAGELSMQAISGLMYATGHPDREPLSLPYSQVALQLGVHAVGAVSAALFQRERTGFGATFDIAGADIAAAYLRIYGSLAKYYGIERKRDGRRAPGSGGRFPFGIFQCQDGWVAMIARTERDWQRMVEMMGSPAWANQPRYTDLHAIAMDYPDEVDELMRPWLMSKTRDEILDLAHRTAIPAAPVRRLSEVLEDPQMASRSFFEDHRAADGFDLRLPGLPVRRS